MKLILTILSLTLMTSCGITAQSPKDMNATTPYHQIPDYPENYTTGNIIARTIDGLGYRYYWATEGLRAEDLEYMPSEDGRSTGETLEHLYGLSLMILNAAKNEANIRPIEFPEHSFEQRRTATLENIQEASKLFRQMKSKEVEKYKIIFQRGEKQSEFPLWNLLNGPLADAIYHTGQIVSYRRSSGNPLNPNVNVFMGKNRAPKK